MLLILVAAMVMMMMMIMMMKQAGMVAGVFISSNGFAYAAPQGKKNRFGQVRLIQNPKLSES